MLRLWLIYNIVILTLIFTASISSASSLTNYLLPLLILPMLYYLGKDLLKKSKRLKLKSSSLYASDIKPSKTLAEPGIIVDDNISDDNRRIFLKLLGTTSLSILFMALIGKDSAKAAFFGSVPGPGTVSIKDSTGATIDPAEKQMTDGYEISQIDDAGNISYYGFVHKNGAWYIIKEESTGDFRYNKGASDFATGWSNRVSLTYDYFDAVF